MKLHLFKNRYGRKYSLLIFDAACLVAVSALYFLLHFALGYLTESDALRYSYELLEYFLDAVLLVLCVLCVRVGMRIYSNVIRYANVKLYLKIIMADAIGGLAAMLVSFLIFRRVAFWFFVTVTALNAILCLCSRFAYHLSYRNRHQHQSEIESRTPIAIIGAGSLGVALAEELRYKKQMPYQPMFFIDVDEFKIGSFVSELRVYGQNEETLEAIRTAQIKELFIAINEPTQELIEGLYFFFEPTGCKLKIYDTSMRECGQDGKTSQGALRDFRIEDLLFRKPLNVNMEEQFGYYTDKVVMVTGGGGSIGSELCRQIAKCSPKHLIIVDIYENNAYDIQQELIRAYGDSLNLTVQIASVRDRIRMEAIFRTYHPEIVFHAAAHKHVPLMESSSCEAVKNNVLGTKNVADMAEKYGVQKFILISTDKAVNPTNVMGASKRMCERVIQCRRDSETTFAAVRFGNVLGSNGSVIPLFRRQIAEGGPVTVTDRRIIRYFMTIPEASQLVMQAGAMASAGELFVLDMGKPVHIYTLAENMIRLSGFRPHIDIEIHEIGLRPGEKLYEELLIKTETLDKTENNMIFIERDVPLTREEVDAKIALLCEAIEKSQYDVRSDLVKQAMKQAIPEFKDPEEINAEAEKSAEMQMSRG